MCAIYLAQIHDPFAEIIFLTTVGTFEAMIEASAEIQLDNVSTQNTNCGEEKINIQQARCESPNFAKKSGFFTTSKQVRFKWDIFPCLPNNFINASP